MKTISAFACGIAVPIFVWMLWLREPVISFETSPLDLLCADYIADPNRYSDVTFNASHLMEIYNQTIGIEYQPSQIWAIYKWILYLLLGITAVTAIFVLTLVLILVIGKRDMTRLDAVVGGIAYMIHYGKFLAAIIGMGPTQRIMEWIYSDNIQSKPISDDPRQRTKAE